MADKLAAGRKMLLEFQKKKCENKQISGHAPESDHYAASSSYIQQIVNSEPHAIQTQQYNPPDIAIQSTYEANENNIPYEGVPFTSSYNKQNTPSSIDPQSDEIIHVNHNTMNNENIKLFQESKHDQVEDIQTLVEISKLHQQLEFHSKTVEFLVMEKNTLLDKLQEYEKMINNLTTQNTDLTGRLNTSRHRVSHLESECTQAKLKNETMETQIAKVLNDASSLHDIENKYKKQIQDLKEELLEMQTLMNDKVSDYRMLLQKYEEINIQLQSNELRLQQMTQGEVKSEDTTLHEHCHNLEQIINTLRQQLSQMEFEKNNASLHYQQFVQQLNNQIQILNDKQEELTKENEMLQYREEGLLQQMNSLEKQLQSSIVHNIPKEQPKVSTSDSSHINNQHVVELETQLHKLKLELDNCKLMQDASLQEINKKEIEIEELKNNINKLESESPDIGKLNAAIESDRVTAQKATLQNTKLKQDIQHLEKAFEQMTKSKLELAELLQAEKNLSKNVTMKLVETEEKLKDVEVKLIAKDEEMIRLQAASSDLEREILKYAQITDRIHHYEAQGKSLDMVQNELQKSRSTIQMLMEENKQLKKLSNQENSSKSEDNLDENIQSSVTSNGDAIDALEDNINVNIPTADAMLKLEKKFTNLMREVADLSDEKQKLEHIVLQLQGETETICEYIALYQKQRNMLKQREMERIVQLGALSKEREHLKQQLEDLKALVIQLNHKTASDAVNNDTPVMTKMLDLITEIKDNHLVQSENACSDLQSLHNCPCCSGKLITV